MRLTLYTILTHGYPSKLIKKYKTASLNTVQHYQHGTIIIIMFPIHTKSALNLLGGWLSKLNENRKSKDPTVFLKKLNYLTKGIPPAATLVFCLFLTGSTYLKS
jgi:hypothetical protein